jgi:hypothetical protein
MCDLDSLVQLIVKDVLREIYTDKFIRKNLQGFVKETKSVASLSGPGDILTLTNTFF